MLRGTVRSEHLVHLFDEPESLVATVSAFLHEGWRRGDKLLVVARAANWALTAAELEALDCPVPELTAEGRLVVLDAATTLAALMVHGAPQEAAFASSVGDVIDRLTADGSGLSIYGEMVDLLVAQRDFDGALQLEALWNALSASYSFRLLCGYSAAHFGDEGAAGRLRAICGAHDHAGARATDLLATWLLSSRRTKLHLDSQ